MKEKENIDCFSELSAGFQKFYHEVLAVDFPHIKPEFNSPLDLNVTKGATFLSKLSLHNLFKDSPYEYAGPDDFLHFTTCQGVYAILRSGYMRASEFRHLTDEYEIRLGLEKVNLLIDQVEEANIDKLRRTAFTFSMCRFDADVLRNQYLWSQYASQSTGVAIRFRIIRPEYEKFAMGSILYGSQNLMVLDRIKSRAESFASAGNLFPQNFIELLVPILAYHKVAAYSPEQEVRIFFQYAGQSDAHYIDKSIFQEINKTNNLRNFKKIPLKELFFNNIDPAYNGTFTDWSKHFLSIQITDIYFGHRIPISDLLDFSKFFNSLKKENGFSYNLWRLNQDNIEIPL